MTVASDMALEIEGAYPDGATERFDLPEDIWNNELGLTKDFFSDRDLVRVPVDPDEASIDRDKGTCSAEVVEHGDAARA